MEKYSMMSERQNHDQFFVDGLLRLTVLEEELEEFIPFFVWN
jgi:hypothetical protein